MDLHQGLMKIDIYKYSKSQILTFLKNKRIDKNLIILDQIFFTKKDYITYMKYGGSYGHNAPAGFHKDSINNIYSGLNFKSLRQMDNE